MNLPPICAAEPPLREWHYPEGAQNLRCEKARKRRREEALSKKRRSREAKKQERAIMQRCKEARISATLGSEHCGDFRVSALALLCFLASSVLQCVAFSCRCIFASSLRRVFASLLLFLASSFLGFSVSSLLRYCAALFVLFFAPLHPRSLVSYWNREDRVPTKRQVK